MGPVTRKRGRRKSKPLESSVVENAISAIQTRRAEKGLEPLEGIHLTRAVYAKLASSQKAGRLRLSIDGWHSDDVAEDDKLKSQWNSQVVQEVRNLYVASRFLGKTEASFDTQADFLAAVKAEVQGNPDCLEDMKNRFGFTPRDSSDRPEGSDAEDLFGDWD